MCDSGEHASGESPRIRASPFQLRASMQTDPELVSDKAMEDGVANEEKPAADVTVRVFHSASVYYN